MSETMTVVPNEQQENTADVVNGSDITTSAPTAPLDYREEKKITKQALRLEAQLLQQREMQLKQNAQMVQELETEARYWKAQADTLEHRYRKMDFYLKNRELQLIYDKAVAEDRAKAELLRNANTEKSPSN